MDIRTNSEGRIWVEVIHGKSRWDIRMKVKGRNTRKETGCGADCTGQIYMTSCKALRTYKISPGYVVAVIECGEYYDV